MEDFPSTCQEGIPSLPAGGPAWENPAMVGTTRTAMVGTTRTNEKDAEKEILIRRLRELIDAHPDMSARKLSNLIGANQAYIGQILSGKGGIPSAVYLRKIAEVLETTTDYLTGKADDGRQPVSEVSFRDPPKDWRGSSGKGVPVLGTGFCDDLAVGDEDGGTLQVERLMLESDHVIRMVARPPGLWAAPDAYAIYYHGSSMEPRFKQGEMGMVDPRRPPSPGDDVVVQLTDGNGGRDVVTVLVKELVRATSSHYELKQYKPLMTFKVPRRQVARIHRIVPAAELYYV